jgi:hypothetical protein
MMNKQRAIGVSAFSGFLESLPVLLWPHGSQGDAKHRPETREGALLTMRVLRPHPEEHRSAMRLEG